MSKKKGEYSVGEVVGRAGEPLLCCVYNKGKVYYLESAGGACASG